VFGSQTVIVVVNVVGVARALADLSDFGFLDEQNSQKWEIPCTGRRYSFILGGEIRTRTNTVNKNKHTHTHKQTVTDISTPCLSACVDINQKVRE